MSLAGRAIRGTAWAGGSSIVVLAVVAVRTVVLARVLPLEAFGAYALATATVHLVGALGAFGLDVALVHRSPETAHEERAARVHFTLGAALTLTWSIPLALAAAFLTRGPLLHAILLLTAARVGLSLCRTPQALLVRRVSHARAATLRATNALLGTAAALTLAWQGGGVWALLAIDAVSCLVTALVLYAWRPVWRPRLGWDGPTVRYFLHFGSRHVLARLLQEAVQRADKLWLGALVDRAVLGLYSRAYAYGSRATSWLSAPLATVAQGTYAELKGDRRRLTRAVTHGAGMLPRGGFLVAGLLALTGDELVPLVLGERWLPMISAFRLLLAAAVCEQVTGNLAQLVLGIGRPGRLAAIRAGQLLVLLASLSLLAAPLGMVGAALGVLGARAFGLLASLAFVRRHVDLSLRRLFAAPGAALGAGLALGWSTGTALGSGAPRWAEGGVEALGFVAGYLSVWLVLERAHMARTLALVRRHLRAAPAGLG